MTKEDKELLLKDLSGRLPYKPKVSLQYGDKQLNGVLDAVYPTEERVIVDELSEAIAPIDVRCGGFKLDENNIKPLLRPMSDMTEEEKEELERLSEEYFGKALDKQIQESLSSSNKNESRILEYIASSVIIDWLNAHHFDYRGLIEKGLAIAITKKKLVYENK